MSEVQEEIAPTLPVDVVEKCAIIIAADATKTPWSLMHVSWRETYRNKAKAILLASGLPAAIEERDKALERVKALEEIVALEVSMTKAEQDVCLERAHQQIREGWTCAHDDEHLLGEMAAAAACYALYGIACTHQHNTGPNLREIWPWAEEWWKPKDNKRLNLVRAGALIIAEIERLDRATPTKEA